MDWKSIITQTLEDFNRTIFFKSLAYSILFSFIITLVLGLFEGLIVPDQQYYLKLADQKYWIGVVFVSFIFVFTSLGYIIEFRYKDDIFTPLRKKLAGVWQVRSEAWVVDNEEISKDRRVSNCTIGIEDVGRKLVMEFLVRDSDLFIDQKFNAKAISFALEGQKRQLFYFCDPKLKLKTQIGDKDEVEFMFIGILNIDETAEDIKIMDGRWYDIDNTMYNVATKIPNLRGLQSFSKSVQNGSITFRGNLVFERIKSPQST